MKRKKLTFALYSFCSKLFFLLENFLLKLNRSYYIDIDFFYPQKYDEFFFLNICIHNDFLKINLSTIFLNTYDRIRQI